MTKHLFMARRFSRENVVFFFFKSLSLSLVMSVHAGSAHWDTPTMRRGTRTEQVSFCQTFQDQISPHSSRFFFFFPVHLILQQTQTLPFSYLQVRKSPRFNTRAFIYTFIYFSAPNVERNVGSLISPMKGMISELLNTF